ncbi:hypothetical protein H5410_051139 [Solanum commersonii]|uniref:Uncharacterized protein n=1 Tax=Solanum commersonii TaxID=4109 RepID=A0A9J5X022_SOLCO|nr:hypothetical protein H5410_051139 [Solanum commersonii]
MSVSHSRSIQLIENLLGHVMSHLHQGRSIGQPNHILASPKKVQIGELPTRSATLTKTAIWILILTEDPVKLDEVDKNLVDRQSSGSNSNNVAEWVRSGWFL